MVLVLVGAFWVRSACTASPLMVDKNLFSQDRKPPSPEEAARPQSGKPGMDIKNIQLDGVIITGNVKRALVRLKGQLRRPEGRDKNKISSPFVTLRENQQVSDFRVVKIETKSISLEKDGQVYTINLFSEGKVITPAASVQPATPAPHPTAGSVAPTQHPPGAPGDQPGQVAAQPSHNPNGQEATDPALLHQQIMQQQRLQQQIQREFLQSQGIEPPPMQPQENEAANGQGGAVPDEGQPQQ